MKYTIGQMAEKLGIAPSTLRYYDKEGLLPFVERSDGGARVFKDADFEWLQVISCLKKTGMRLNDIRAFVELSMKGDETIEARLALIVEQKKAVQAMLAEMKETLRVLEFKEWYYTTAKKNGTTAIPREMSEAEIPERFRKVRRQLKGI